MTNVLIRDVPEEELAILRHEAEAEGKSLQSFMLSLMRERIAEAKNRDTIGRIRTRARKEGARYSREELQNIMDSPRQSTQ